MAAVADIPTATAAPPTDPVRAALDDPALLERIRRHARASLRGRIEGVEDVFSEVCVRAMEKRDRYDSARGAVAQWLSGITDFVLKERHRKVRRDAVVDLAGHEPGVASDAGRDMDVAEAKALAERFLAKLPTDFRAVVELRFRHDLDFAAIAAKLNLTPANARQRYRRAMIRLTELATQEGRS